MGIIQQLTECINKQARNSNRPLTVIYLGREEWKELKNYWTQLQLPLNESKDLFMGLTVYRVSENSHIGVY